MPVLDMAQIKKQAKAIKQYLEQKGYKITHSSRIKYLYIARLKFVRKGRFIELPVEHEY